MRRLSTLLLVLLLGLCSVNPAKADDGENAAQESSTYNGLHWRSIGPAFTSGRVSDFAVDPVNHNRYFVASASGGVWKTTNNGTTYEPIFDSQGSYSIGCITMDPNNSNVLWVGTGENNNQRSVSYGDGVYLSRDGGKTWKNMGLEHSEHIGMIAVDPRNSDVVYVAAYGPLWDAGGERGLYKTTDGGQTWNKVLDISQYTGISEVHLDPRHPDIVYATAHQRMRKTWTYLGGGPESALYKSTDGGQNWKKLDFGIDKDVDLGRIGMDISPADPDVVYAIVEAQYNKGGFYRSTDRGESWTKMSDMSTSGNYYQELIADPQDVNKVYVMDTFGKVTKDGGKTFDRIGNKWRHVDDHAFWINPDDTDNLLIGDDGGVYETTDGENWKFSANLPITQFYDVAVDSSKPFYYIYGGTQDNNSMGGPSRTINEPGIMNSDWFITAGGDGFNSVVDPKNPNIVYSESQYGNLVRYDRKSGEQIFIQPQVEGDQEPLVWNWDTPLMISPHDSKRLYIAANQVYRSDDRGSTWKVISPDLTRQLDRNKMPLMGRTWSVDAVSKNQSTSIWGSVVALEESPLQEDLLYAGTDDGLIQVTDDGGDHWRKIDEFPDVPKLAYVDEIVASPYDVNTVYAVFNNHKQGDFKPYILKSTDQGKSWKHIDSTLPERGSVYSLAEDYKMPGLLFAGTEFGIYFSRDDGQHWMNLGSGLPTVAVRDMAIQRREDDLVLATFGRGFYVLDDYSVLRHADNPAFDQQAHLFPISDSWMFMETNPLGYSGKGFQGSAFYTGDNPPVGATFTYYLKDKLETLKEQRHQQEQKLQNDNKDVEYPSIDRLKKEDREEQPYLLFQITDADGNVIRRMKADGKKTGIQRITWDFRYPASTPIELNQGGPSAPWSEADQGHWALPGTYYVQMFKYEQGKYSQLTEKQPFDIKFLHLNELAPEERDSVVAFEQKVADLRRAIRGANRFKNELQDKLKHMDKAIKKAPNADYKLKEKLGDIEQRIYEWDQKMNGDDVKNRNMFPAKPGVMSRVENIVYGLWNSTSAPTTTMQTQFNIAADKFEPLLSELKSINRSVKSIEQQLEDAGAPYTPGRIPDWNRQ